MCINKNVAQKRKFTLSACLPACAFGENDLNAVCLTQRHFYVCVYEDYTQKNFYVLPEKKSICKAYAIYVCM
jgi:hypothetical protein